MNNEASYWKTRLELKEKREQREATNKKLGAVAASAFILTASVGFGMHKTNEIERTIDPETSTVEHVTDTNPESIYDTGTVVLDERPVPVERPYELNSPSDNTEKAQYPPVEFGE